MTVEPIKLADAKKIIVARHYMRTWPKGAAVAFGVFLSGKCRGVMVFGYSPTTEKKIKKHCNNLDKSQYIELQRTWVDDVLGHNSESWFMARSIKYLKDKGMWLILTHSGGCKDDVGFIFQASGWLYFGEDKCNDFFKTKKGEFKNLVSAMRFGRAPKHIMQQGAQKTGEYLFGEGEIVNARRHLYLYPIKKGLRKRLNKIKKENPKNPKEYRYGQKWVKKDMEMSARGANA